MRLAHRPNLYHPPTMIQLQSILQRLVDQAVAVGRANVHRDELSETLRAMRNGEPFRLAALRTEDSWINSVPYTGNKTVDDHARWLAQPVFVIDVPHGQWTRNRPRIKSYFAEMADNFVPLPGCSAEDAVARAAFFRNWDKGTYNHGPIVAPRSQELSLLTGLLGRVYSDVALYTPPHNLIYSKNFIE